MARVSLQDMIEDIRFDDLPANWTHFDLITFSRDKELWDYQQRALRNAITALHKYYEDFADYQPKESADINKHRKHKFAQWYRDNGQEEDLDIALNSNRTLSGLLGEGLTREEIGICCNRHSPRSSYHAGFFVKSANKFSEGKYSADDRSGSHFG